MKGLHRTRPLPLAVLAVLVIANVAFARSSLGIGSNEATIPANGLFGGFLAWINMLQQGFYRDLTEALKAMREGSASPLPLIALSFAYGVFHAAGPGHGKAVISSYMLANEAALRRGVILSFVSALLQALTALVVISAAFLVLRGSSVTMTNATRFLEVSSYLLIALFGAWLLWRKAAMILHPVRLSSAASVAPGHHHDEHPRYHHHDDGSTCSTCGHSHAPDPALLSGTGFKWKTAWSAVAAVGIRPCSGALIVLTFSFLNGLWLPGVVSVLAMAVGTALTVSGFATLAVTAKHVAVSLSGGGIIAARVHNAIEISGAAIVMVLGIVLLAASLSG